MLVLLGLAGCASPPQSDPLIQTGSHRSHDRARSLAANGDLEASIQWLRKSYRNGFDRPMDVVRDPKFSPLIQDSESRLALRDLLRESARESDVWMVRDDEPGAGIVVAGTVVEERDGRPIAGALVELVHADARGRYSIGDATFNPRLFALLRTDHEGRFRVRTIRPGAYRDDEGELIPHHIHFSIQAPGFRNFNSEFVFDDDPLLTPERRREVLRDSLPIAHHVSDVVGISEYAVTIPLQASP